jgi:GLPGLI family protein
MKKSFLIVISFIFGYANIYSQNIRVIYEEKMQPVVQTNDPQISAAMNAQFAEMKKTMHLTYDKGESIYEPQSKADNEQTQTTQSGMTMVMISNDVVVYKNQGTKEIVSQESIIDRKFRIVDSLTNFEWQLSDEEKVINNFKCRKATDRTGITVAWYCPDIPINDGPYIFWGLPGLIIELSHQNMTVTATKVEQIKEEGKYEIKSPSEGKIVSRNEFNVTLQKKMMEMNQQQGQGGVQLELDIQK